MPAATYAGPVVDRERDQQAVDPRLEELVGQQRDAVQRDRDQARERGLLVEGDELAPRLRRAAEAGGEREADQDRGGDEHERHDARRAADQPEGVLLGVHRRPPRGPDPALGPSPAGCRVVHAATTRRTTGRGSRTSSAVVVDDQPAVPAQPASRVRRAAQQRGLGERLGLDGGGRQRGRAEIAGPGRLERARVEEVVARRAVGRAPQPRVEARGRDARPSTRSTCAVSPVSGWRTWTSNGSDTRMSPPQSTAQRPCEPVREQVRGEALARAAGVEPEAGRAGDRALADRRPGATARAGSVPPAGAAVLPISASASGSSGARRVRS